MVAMRESETLRPAMNPITSWGGFLREPEDEVREERRGGGDERDWEVEDGWMEDLVEAWRTRVRYMAAIAIRWGGYRRWRSER